MARLATLGFARSASRLSVKDPPPFFLDLLLAPLEDADSKEQYLNNTREENIVWNVIFDFFSLENQ